MTGCKVLMIGLDGLSFRMLNSLADRGITPFLSQFSASCAYSELMSTLPHVSPVAWTSLVTGCGPGAHGIFDFVKADDHSESMYFTLYNATDIGRETIWSILSRYGRRVTTLNYMLTFPPPPIEGYVVPGLVSWRHFRQGVRPSKLYEYVRDPKFVDMKTMGWDFKLERKVLDQVEPSEYESFIRFHIERESNWYNVARHLLTTDPTDFVTVVFDGPDKLFHIFWRFLDPELDYTIDTEWERSIQLLCLDYFAHLDRYLRSLVSCVGPETTVIIVSDHGFGPSSEVFRVNSWLHEQGYLTWRSADNETDPDSFMRRIDSNFAYLDWSRTSAYVRTPSSNGIYIRSPDGDGWRTSEGYRRFRAQLAADLLNLRHPLSGGNIVSAVVTREQGFPGRNSAAAPDLTLVLEDWGFASIRNLQPVIFRRPEIAGTHRPEGIFLAKGPWIRPGKLRDTLSILDVAPLLLYSFDIPLPRDFEGRLPVELIQEDFLADHPPRSSSLVQPPELVSPTWPDRDDAMSDDPVLQRLRALGYIE